MTLNIDMTGNQIVFTYANFKKQSVNKLLISYLISIVYFTLIYAMYLAIRQDKAVNIKICFNFV